MTSVYRQIGIGCEKVFHEVLQDALDLSNDDVIWSYATPTPGGKTRKLMLDGRVPLDSIKDAAVKARRTSLE